MKQFDLAAAKVGAAILIKGDKGEYRFSIKNRGVNVHIFEMSEKTGNQWVAHLNDTGGHIDSNLPPATMAPVKTTYIFASFNPVNQREPEIRISTNMFTGERAERELHDMISIHFKNYGEPTFHEIEIEE
jgi:hypothetical protein